MVTAWQQRGLVGLLVILSAACASRPRMALQPQLYGTRERVLVRPLMALRGGWVNKPGTECDASCHGGRKTGEDGAMEGDANCTGGDESAGCPHGTQQNGNKDLHCMECEVMAFLQVKEQMIDKSFCACFLFHLTE